MSGACSLPPDDDAVSDFCLRCVCLSLVLNTVDDDPLNDSLGNPGLISPDKEDLSRLLVRNGAPCNVLVCFLAPRGA